MKVSLTVKDALFAVGLYVVCGKKTRMDRCAGRMMPLIRKDESNCRAIRWARDNRNGDDVEEWVMRNPLRSRTKGITYRRRVEYFPLSSLRMLSLSKRWMRREGNWRVLGGVGG